MRTEVAGIQRGIDQADGESGLKECLVTKCDQAGPFVVWVDPNKLKSVSESIRHLSMSVNINVDKDGEADISMKIL